MLAGIVLAAGLSSRMGEEKLLLPFGEGTVLEAAISRIPNGVELSIIVQSKHARNFPSPYRIASPHRR